MIAAVCALAAVVVLLGVAVIMLVQDHEVERREWRDERRGLVDRAIAQHTGEIVALDRQAAPKPMRMDSPMRPTAEGL